MTLKHYCIQIPTYYVAPAIPVAHTIMAEEIDSMDGEIRAVAKELNVAIDVATDVVYLRSRTRWTQALEKRLLELHAAGTPPNIMEFGTWQYEKWETACGRLTSRSSGSILDVPRGMGKTISGVPD